MKSYLIHLRVHVRRNESVKCPVKHCSFSTNIIGTYGSHMSKTHSLLTSSDIKDTLKVSHQIGNSAHCGMVTLAESDSESTSMDMTTTDMTATDDSDSCQNSAESTEGKSLTTTQISNEVALLYLKMKCIYSISVCAIQNIFEDVSN